MKRLIVGISGATGVQMGYRLLQALRTFEDIRDQGMHDWEYCNRHVEKFLNWIPLTGTFEMEAQ